MQNAIPSNPVRTAFLLLLFANLAFFAWVENVPLRDGREPQRLETQMEAQKVIVLPATQANMPAVSQVPERCRTFSGLTVAAARALQVELAQSHPVLRLVMPQSQGESFWVFIPPQANRAAAEKKITELRQMGVADAVLLVDKGPHQHAISLGLFRNEGLASAYLERLAKKGVRSARLEAQARQSISDQEKTEVSLIGPADLLQSVESTHASLGGLSPGDCTAP